MSPRFLRIVVEALLDAADVAEEWSALERRYIDRNRRLVKVEQKEVDASIVRGAKTKNSVAEVPLTGRALAALDLLPPRLDTPLLFPAPEGGPLNLDNFRKREWAHQTRSPPVRPSPCSSLPASWRRALP